MSNPPSRQGSVDLSAGAQTELIGYQPEYSFVNLQRLKLRSVMDTLVFEAGSSRTSLGSFCAPGGGGGG